MPSLPAAFRIPLLSGCLAAFLAAAGSLFMPNYYRSEARILPVDSKGAGALGNLTAAAAAIGLAMPGADSSDASYVDILASQWLREELLKTRFRFHERTWRFGAERERDLTLQDYLGARNLDQGLAGVSRILSTSRDLKTKLLSIRAETRSPELSQGIVRRASALLETFLVEKGRTRGGNKAAFAVQRLQEARREYTQAEMELRRFLENNRNYTTSPDPAVRLAGMRLDAELRLRQQLVASLAMNREQALLEEKNDLPILNVLDAGSLPAEKSRPSRSTIVLGCFLSATAAAGAWGERRRILALLFNHGTGT